MNTEKEFFVFKIVVLCNRDEEMDLSLLLKHDVLLLE
jgi:hypothetical protein